MVPQKHSAGPRSDIPTLPPYKIPRRSASASGRGPTGSNQPLSFVVDGATDNQLSLNRIQPAVAHDGPPRPPVGWAPLTAPPAPFVKPLPRRLIHLPPPPTHPLPPRPPASSSSAVPSLGPTQHSTWLPLPSAPETVPSSFHSAAQSLRLGPGAYKLPPGHAGFLRDNGRYAHTSPAQRARAPDPKRLTSASSPAERERFLDEFEALLREFDLLHGGIAHLLERARQAVRGRTASELRLLTIVWWLGTCLCVQQAKMVPGPKQGQSKTQATQAGISVATRSAVAEARERSSVQWDVLTENLVR